MNKMDAPEPIYLEQRIQSMELAMDAILKAEDAKELQFNICQDILLARFLHVDQSKGEAQQPCHCLPVFGLNFAHF